VDRFASIADYLVVQE